MILPSQPPSSNDGGDRDRALPPPYQEAVPPSQVLPSGRPTASLYAPSVSSRSGPPSERAPAPYQNYPDEKSLPRIPTGRTDSDPPLSPSTEKGRQGEGPGQSPLNVFSSMVWGPVTSTSPRSPNPASTSNTSTTQYQDPLNPSPSAFARPAPKNYAYLPFQPMTMLGISFNLVDGFPMLPPPINPDDERSAGRTNPQHPFVSHDVTEEDWLKFLADIKTVASSPGQTQKSFFARIFLSEVNEKEQRKRVVHFIDSWNHYFFQPRHMSVVLARGRKIFGGVSVNHHYHSPGHHRRHSTGHGRGRNTDLTQTKGQKTRHRSRSTDSSSSDSSTSSSDSSIHSAASEPPEMPVPETHEPSLKGPLTSETSKEDPTYHGWDNPRGRGGRGGRGWDSSCGSRGGRGWDGSRGGRGGCGGRGWDGGGGWGTPGSGPSTAPPAPGLGGGLEGGEPWSSRGGSLTHREQKRAWKAERRGMKYERRRYKRALKHERRQRKWEAKAAMRRGEGHSKEAWKLIISFHGARREVGEL